MALGAALEVSDNNRNIEGFVGLVYSFTPILLILTLLDKRRLQQMLEIFLLDRKNL